MKRILYNWLNKNFNIDEKHSDEIYYFIIDYGYEIIKIENNNIYLYDTQENETVCHNCREYIKDWIDIIQYKIDLGVDKQVRLKWEELIIYLQSKII